MAFWQFPKDFVWGTATASYQVEGAYSEDGRAMSIWDTFCRTPGKVKHGHTGDITCDQYHRYLEDIKLMRELGVKSYRFSLAWPRIYPQGKGQRNPKGFDYYHRLVDALLEAGIDPAVTLYHWDLPQALEDEGGWPFRDTAYHYAEYAKTCFEELGDKVKTWITQNEPWCTSWLGYGIGKHAPGRIEPAAAVRAIHYLNLGHGLAVKAFRQGGYKGTIGVTHNLAGTRPATNCEQDLLAADRARDLSNRMWLDPVFGRGYPQRFLDAHPDWPVPVRDGDMKIIKQPIDFIGVNFYWENVFAFDATQPEQFRMVNDCYERTDFDWPITPLGIYRMLKWTWDEYRTPMYVTENGCAMPDKLTPDGMRCRDRDRIDYLRGYIGQIAHAICDGIDVRGYYLWSLIDNFEWAEGFTKRFGIVYCDYANQRRIPKDSYYYYREVTAGNEFFGYTEPDSAAAKATRPKKPAAPKKAAKTKQARGRGRR